MHMCTMYISCILVVIEVVTISTVHEMLFREVVIHGVSLLEVASVDHRNGGKSCTASTLFLQERDIFGDNRTPAYLVLDRGDSSLGHPTPFSWSCSSHFFKLLHEGGIFDIFKLSCAVIVRDA